MKQYLHIKMLIEFKCFNISGILILFMASCLYEIILLRIMRLMETLFEGAGRVQLQCEEFEVRDHNNRTMFKVTDKAVEYGVSEVSYSGRLTVTFMEHG